MAFNINRLYKLTKRSIVALIKKTVPIGLGIIVLIAIAGVAM